MPTGGVDQRIVYGASWRRHAPRRLQAARIARLLLPIVERNGGTVSTEFTVEVGGRWYRPDVGALLDCEPPLDGILARAPELIVSLGGPLSAQAWLDAGAVAVWWASDGAPTVISARGDTAPEEGWLTLPGWPTVRLLAAELRVGTLPRTRRARL